MTFKNFNNQIQQQFKKMCKTGQLYRADIPGSALWKLYLTSFEDESTFRDPESSEHNCNNCTNFIRRYGNIVSIDDNGKIQTLFSGIEDAGEYTVSAKALDKVIKASKIKDIFLESYKMLNEKLNYESCKKNQATYKLGIAVNRKKYTEEEAATFGVVEAGKIYEFNHFSIDLPKKYVNQTTSSIESILAGYRAKYDVFERAMREIPLDTLKLVKDLINQGSLLDGPAHLHAVENAIGYKELYDTTAIPKDIYCWYVTYDMSIGHSRFKNDLIGVLCTELAEGMELNKACLNWNKRVDPANYHKATAPITKRQIEAAQKFVEENGYEASFSRRLATIDDIKASEIKHINIGDGKIKEVSMFDTVKSISTQHKRSQFDKLEVVTIDKFMKDILPTATSVAVLLENRMEGNLAVLTTAKLKKSKPIFKWDNNYSWTFNGNLAGKSQIKEAVKAAGGNVEGVLNFRLAWNDKDKDNSDLDAWAKEPSGTRIGFSTRYMKKYNTKSPCSGQLDVDNQGPGGQLAVENITWTNKNQMTAGDYILWVNQYAARNSKGFKAEIEFDGEIYSYSYDKSLHHKKKVQVAIVTLKNGVFSIKHNLPESNSSKTLWKLDTNAFHKVNLMCLSPNHWGSNAVGNLHYFFMLDKCKTKSDIRGFHNENLLPDLLAHKKVIEVLGNTNMITPGKKQLAGLGFNSTVRDQLIVKVSGSHKRMLKIQF